MLITYEILTHHLHIFTVLLNISFVLVLIKTKASWYKKN